MYYFLRFSKVVTFLGLLATLKEFGLRARSYHAKKHDSDEFYIGNIETNVLKKRYVVLTKYHGSLSNPSQANGHFREQIFARECNNSGETKEVFQITLTQFTTSGATICHISTETSKLLSCSFWSNLEIGIVSFWFISA